MVLVLLPVGLLMVVPAYIAFAVWDEFYEVARGDPREQCTEAYLGTGIYHAEILRIERAWFPPSLRCTIRVPSGRVSAVHEPAGPVALLVWGLAAHLFVFGIAFVAVRRLRAGRRARR